MTDAKPYQIRGTQQTLLALRVENPEAPAFFDQLRDDVLRSPGFFKNAPLVIDVQPLAGAAPVDLRKFVARLRACDLQPIGVSGGDDGWNDAARAVGLSVLAGGRLVGLDATAADAPAPPAAAVAGAAPEHHEPAPTTEPAPALTPASNLVFEQVVRSGQQLVADRGDAVCLAPVSNGADVIAKGNIHVYAALRGRAFAGFDGDRTTMIFCDRLEAELVSIAGYHLVSDELPAQALGKRVRIRLAQDALVVDVMG